MAEKADGPLCIIAALRLICPSSLITANASQTHSSNHLVLQNIPQKKFLSILLFFSAIKPGPVLAKVFVSACIFISNPYHLAHIIQNYLQNVYPSFVRFPDAFPFCCLIYEKQCIQSILYRSCSTRLD